MPLVNQTSYSNQDVNVDTSGPGGPGGLDVDPFFMSMAKRRMRLEAEQAAIRNRGMRFDLAKKQRDALPPASRTPDWGAQAEVTRDRSYKKRLQDADLNVGGQNLKMRHGFNIEPGYGTDTELLPLSMRPKSASFGQAEENTAGIDPKSAGTGGFDPVAAEDAARGELGAPGGNLSSPSFDNEMLGMRAKISGQQELAEIERKRQQKQAQQQYFSGRG